LAKWKNVELVRFSNGQDYAIQNYIYNETFQLKTIENLDWLNWTKWFHSRTGSQFFQFCMASGFQMFTV
jgi:hypothetical protein